jgi:hypothetical protein
MSRNIKQLILNVLFLISLFITSGAQNLPKDFIDPPHEFSVMPFWFWNDTLKDEEIIRQIADFDEHGVYGFVIHPRIGLPGNIKWLSPEMIHFMDVAISEASRRKIHVVLYDEGMYPSGSSSGQVVARNPAYAARGFSKIDLKAGEKPDLSEGMKLVTVSDRPDGSRVAIVEQPSRGVIRGLHYIGEDRGGRLIEESPPAGDILNPDAVTSFIELVYDKYAESFRKYFSNTIIGIFTDEPAPLGRGGARGILPGNASLLPQINRILGYDITPFLADLWYNDTPGSLKHRSDYNRAINICLEENYYKRLGNWCSSHKIALMGHPAGSMDIGTERYFQIPGQDLVWRYVEPGPKALEGQHSTMAKCASSAMVHFGCRRNANELYGAYGHNLTFDEMVWLANWCFVRGQNLLIPHAFYYSIRGPRFDERPPDVGPNSSWWTDYKPYSDACRRLSWINTDSKQVCDIAILCDASWLPDEPAKTLYQHQRDFNYLELRHLMENARITSKGISIAGMTYTAVVLDTLSFMPPKAKPILRKLARSRHLIISADSKFVPYFKGAIVYNAPDDLINAINRISTSEISLNPVSEAIRYRHVVKNSDHYYLLFNEENSEVSTRIKLGISGDRQPASVNASAGKQASGSWLWVDPFTAETKSSPVDGMVIFKPYEMKILMVRNIK